tara:strand:- start:271 stop:504 length:234 start_codon:yes stop_codon:yes gene_type:complete
MARSMVEHDAATKYTSSSQRNPMIWTKSSTGREVSPSDFETSKGSSPFLVKQERLVPADSFLRFGAGQSLPEREEKF